MRLRWLIPVSLVIAGGITAAAYLYLRRDLPRSSPAALHNAAIRQQLADALRSAPEKTSAASPHASLPAMAFAPPSPAA